MAVHLGEVGIDAVVQKERVEVFLFARLLEWEDTLNENEKDNSG